MEQKEEITLELSWDIVDQCAGFGLDFGGSVCKVIYLHRDDWVEKTKRISDTVSLRCVTFPRHEDEKLEYLKKIVHVCRRDTKDKPLVFTTGIGGSQYATKIRETFGIQTHNIAEFECFVAGFMYMLKNLKIKDATHEIDQSLINSELAKSRSMLKIYGNLVEHSTHMDRKDIPATITFAQETPLDRGKKFVDYEDIFPCFVSMIGSNGCTFVIKEDGTYEFASDLRRAGKSFMSLASLLTGAKSYHELMEKAGRGNMRNVHEYISDMSQGVDQQGEDKDNVYGIIKDIQVDNDKPGFLFGKCLFQDLDKFKSEDLARSLLQYSVGDMVQVTHMPLFYFKNVRHCFIAGGFPTHELVREMIFTEWMDRETAILGVSNEKTTHYVHFLKHAAFLGALGAYLNPKLQFEKLDEDGED